LTRDALRPLPHDFLQNLCVRCANETEACPGCSGPWAGKILTGDENTGSIFAVDTNGVAEEFQLGVYPEDFDIIRPNQDLYCAVAGVVSPGDGPIMKLSRTLLTNYVGDLLITEAGEYDPGLPRLHILHWDGTRFVQRWISHNATFEHVTFAPINLPTLP